MRRDKCRIITSAVEHPSVFEPFAALKAQGYDVVVVGVDKTGCVRMDELSAALTESTGYVSIMHVNNEVGAVNDINGIYHLVREKAPQRFSIATVCRHTSKCPPCNATCIPSADISLTLLKA